MSAGQGFIPVPHPTKQRQRSLADDCDRLPDPLWDYSKKKEHTFPGGDQAHSDGPGVL